MFIFHLYKKHSRSETFFAFCNFAWTLCFLQLTYIITYMHFTDLRHKDSGGLIIFPRPAFAFWGNNLAKALTLETYLPLSLKLSTEKLHKTFYFKGPSWRHLIAQIQEEIPHLWRLHIRLVCSFVPLFEIVPPCVWNISPSVCYCSFLTAIHCAVRLKGVA